MRTPRDLKAYLVIENEVRDEAAFTIYAAHARSAIEAAGGRRIAVGGRVFGLVGDTPSRVVITEWESLEKAQAWRESPAFARLAPLRAEAIRTLRVYVVEGAI
jgi:uncharacterized protein (DUF1330 family)